MVRFSLFVLSLFGLSVQAITIKSECDKPIWYAIGWNTGGGADGLGDSGSWAKAHSKGWYRIGPYQSVDVNAKFIRIEKGGGGAITRVENEGDGNDKKVVVPFCLRPQGGSEGFDLTYFSDNNGQQESRNAFRNCMKDDTDLVMKPFEDVSKYGTYTVYQSGCDPDDQKENPEKLKTRFRLNDKGYAFFNAGGYNPKVWYKIDIDNYSYVEHMYEEKRNDDWIILRPNNQNNTTRYGLGKEGNYQVKYPNQSNWTNLGNIGRWSDR